MRNSLFTLLLIAAAQISQSGMIARTFHRATMCVPHYNKQFRARQFARELHTAKDVAVNEIPRNANTEHVTYALVEEKFC